MASCATCGTTILFGGVNDGGVRFCNAQCHARGGVLLAAQQVPAELVRAEAQAIQRGPCPRCKRTGRGVDLHRSHRIYSALAFTKWSSRAHVCCRACAARSRLLDAVFCAALGWWGFPWGLLMTPVQILRNVAGLFGGERPVGSPSPDLEQAVRLQLASAALQQQAQPRAAAMVR